MREREREREGGRAHHPAMGGDRHFCFRKEGQSFDYKPRGQRRGKEKNGPPRSQSITHMEKENRKNLFSPILDLSLVARSGEPSRYFRLPYKTQCFSIDLGKQPFQKVN